MTHEIRLASVLLFVRNLDRSLRFFRDVVGLHLHAVDAENGYVSFDAGAVRMGLAEVGDPSSELVGRQTGFSFSVQNLALTHEDLAGRGVRFLMEPTAQPWGTLMASFEDPDGNVFFLEQPAAH